MNRSRFLQNVCYIKHYRVFLYPIIYNYWEEYIWKDDAKGIEPESENHGFLLTPKGWRKTATELQIPLKLFGSYSTRW